MSTPHSGRAARGRRAGFPGPLLVFAICLVVYLATLTEAHTFDALSYVMDVDRKPWQELFHPHHLAYGPLGALVRGVLAVVGGPASVLVPLQVVNAIAGAAGVALFFALVRDVTGRGDVAISGALLLASSYAYWYYAVEVEVYTIAALFLVGCLWLLVGLVRAPTVRGAALLGLAQGVAILFHQTNVLLCGAVGVALLLAQVDSRRVRRHTLALAYGGPLALVVGGSYALVGFGIGDVASVGGFMVWITSYAHTGWWGGALSGNTWADLGEGLAGTLAQPGGALLGLLLVGLVVVYLRHVLLAYRRVAICLIVWFLCYSAFFTWWEADNIEFWIASLPPALLLLALALSAAGPRWHAGVWIALAVGGTMAGVNYDSLRYRGSSEYDQHRHLAAALAERSNTGDLLLVSDGLLALYLSYYEARHDVWSFNQSLRENGGHWPLACRQIQQQIETALGRGDAVFLSEGVIYPSRQVGPFQDPVVERFGLNPENVIRCFAGYRPVAEELAMGPGFPRYYRLPTAQELADGPGWDFSSGRWGWQAVNIYSERMRQGWDFIPGIDPQLHSPPLVLDTTDYQAIEIRMSATAATTQTARFELFWLNEDGLVNEAHAVERTLERTGTPETYRITLEGREGWEGIMRGFRLDPVGEGDGGRVRVEWIGLEPAVSPPE